MFYRLYRRLRLKAQVSRSAPLTVERAVERRALLTYATEDAGVPTPRLRALIRVGPGGRGDRQRAATTGPRWPSCDAPPTDARRSARCWDTGCSGCTPDRVTHRALTAATGILGCRAGRRQPRSDGDSGVMLLEPGNGDVAASDLQLRLDLAQLLAELALLVGPDRAAGHRPAADRRRRAGRRGAAAPAGGAAPVDQDRRCAAARTCCPPCASGWWSPAADREVAPAQLERIRPRTLISLVATVVAVYLLVGQLDRVKLGGLLRHADWRWTAAALALSAVSYVGAAWSLSGFVLERLRLFRTLLAQLAGSFVTLVTPAAVGGVALNLRYLRRAEVAPADAAASVGLSQLIAFALHAILLIIFAALAGTAHAHSLRPPGWAYIAIAAVVAAVLVALAFPGGRRLLRSRLAPALGQVIPRLLDIAQQPVKLAEGIGGALLVTAAYILLPADVGAGPGRLGAVRERRHRLPDRQRDRLGGSDARRPRCRRGCPVGGPDGRWHARHHGGQRRAALPDGDVLAAGAARLAGPDLPAAPRSAVTTVQPGRSGPGPYRAGAIPGRASEAVIR